VVNDGFIKIFRSFASFNFRNNEDLEMILMGWMRRIMINTSIDVLRKNNFIPEIGEIAENIWLEDRSQAADKTILYKEIIQEVKKLPPSYRTAFNMFVIDGFTHQEIATQLGITVGTSKSNLSKAKVLLQKYIKESNEVEYAAIQ
jgi:RNA polymerase sigma factor (sigma-70 family)